MTVKMDAQKPKVKVPLATEETGANRCSTAGDNNSGFKQKMVHQKLP
jgi:hypothetical protein